MPRMQRDPYELIVTGEDPYDDYVSAPSPSSTPPATDDGLPLDDIPTLITPNLEALAGFEVFAPGFIAPKGKLKLEFYVPLSYMDAAMDLIRHQDRRMVLVAYAVPIPKDF